MGLPAKIGSCKDGNFRLGSKEIKENTYAGNHIAESGDDR